MLEDNVGDDVSGITTTVNDLLEQFIEIFHGHHLRGLIPPAVKILQDLQDQSVRLTFNALEKQRWLRGPR